MPKPILIDTDPGIDDAVAIALPNGLHVSSTRACLDAGVKNILLEKPIANTVEEAQEIIERKITRCE